MSEERRFEVEKKSEPTQSQAADRFEQRIRQHRQQHKEEMEVRVLFVFPWKLFHLYRIGLIWNFKETKQVYFQKMWPGMALTYWK